MTGDGRRRARTVTLWAPLLAVILSVGCAPAVPPASGTSSGAAPGGGGAVGVQADMLNRTIGQATIGSTICVAGYTARIRPPVSYTEPLKIRQLASYGYADRNPADYEEDHVVSLEAAGSPI